MQTTEGWRETADHKEKLASTAHTRLYEDVIAVGARGSLSDAERCGGLHETRAGHEVLQQPRFGRCEAKEARYRAELERQRRASRRYEDCNGDLAEGARGARQRQHMGDRGAHGLVDKRHADTRFARLACAYRCRRDRRRG